MTAAAHQPHAAGADPTLAPRLVAALRLRAGRGPLCTLLAQVMLTIQDGMVQIACRDGAQMTQAHTYLVPLLPTMLAELGIPARVVVRVQP